ncbi:DUF4446 family protein [Anaerostipes sp. MSJ-23]|uniref:DUF4446 family protein n=1 Tax=unclassified Anaerostipes TaxID=2635253 RepID=UPI001C12515E|nr:DUF4446 family protein [Anaerostipes sp. MSJ-23]MBU5460729.1 DUF4446 family protein [Anaerostipes sp. MSJ-23]
MWETIRSVDILYITMGLAALVVLSFLLIIALFIKTSKLKKRYEKFLSGNDGKSLEKSIFDRFEKMENIAQEQNVIEEEINDVRNQYSNTYSKMKIYKYDAFSDMGGETSFVLGLLDKNNDGMLLNSMMSQSGTYVYAKEITGGKSKVALSKEEMITLEDCMNQ